MEAWTNSSTGGDESLPEGAPSGAPVVAEVTPTPHPATREASNVATPLPEAAVPTPLPTMVSGEIRSAPAPVIAAVAVTPAQVTDPPPSVVIAAPAPAAAPSTAVHARSHAGDDAAFSDQIINWMRQGDRLADPRPVEDLDLLDVAEPTDPVAHELLDSRKQSRKAGARAGRVGRWLSVGALGVAMSFGLYWAAQEPGPPAAASAAVLAPTIEPTSLPAAPAPAPVAPAPPANQIAVAASTPAAASPAPARHKHRRGAGAGRIHRRHGR